MAQGDRLAILESGALTDGELDAIRQRIVNSSAGPWRCFIEGRDHLSGEDFIKTAIGDICFAGDITVSDCDFIAHSRQDLPRLVAEIDRLRQFNEFLRERISTQAQDGDA